MLKLLFFFFYFNHCPKLFPIVINCSSWIGQINVCIIAMSQNQCEKGWLLLVRLLSSKIRSWDSILRTFFVTFWGSSVWSRSWVITFTWSVKGQRMIRRLHLDRLARRCSEIREIQTSVGMGIQTKIPRSVWKETCDLSQQTLASASQHWGQFRCWGERRLESWLLHWVRRAPGGKNKKEWKGSRKSAF